MSQLDGVPTDTGEPVRGLQRPELRVLGLLEAAADAFREMEGVTVEELQAGDRLLTEGRRLVLARPAMQAYAKRLRPCRGDRRAG